MDLSTDPARRNAAHNPLAAALRGVALAIVLAGATGLAACTAPTPANVAVNASGEWYPESGYVWNNPENLRSGVTWSPGARHREYPNISATETAGSWTPDPGYRWLTGADGDLQTVWQAGRSHPQYAHVRSHTVEGQWITDPGYRLSTPGQLSQAVWTPGDAHRDYANVLADGQEGYWRPAAGYAFTRSGDLSSASWTPGLQHPSQPYVYATVETNVWRPAYGYRWANDLPGDFTVVSNTVNSSDEDDPGAKFFRVLGNLAGAAVADAVSRPQDEDGFITTTFVRPLAGAVRDNRLQAAADALR